jgi:hypothetical protein
MDMCYPSVDKSHFWGNGAKLGCKPAFKLAIDWFKANSELFNKGEFRVCNLSKFNGPLSKIIKYRDFNEFCL